MNFQVCIARNDPSITWLRWDIFKFTRAATERNMNELMIHAMREELANSLPSLEITRNDVKILQFLPGAPRAQ